MKKLRLNVTNLVATEILSREELKKVLGGTGSGSGSTTYNDCSTRKTKSECEKTPSDCLTSYLSQQGKCYWATFTTPNGWICTVGA